MRGDVGYDGITGAMKVAHACEGLGIDIEFHGAGPVQRQCMAATRNTNYYEMGLIHPKAPASHAGDLHRLRGQPDRGRLQRATCRAAGSRDSVSQIDWDWVEHHRTGLVVYEP